MGSVWRWRRGCQAGHAIAPGPCLSCGCEAVGPFLINRELLLTVLSFIYLCVMFGSRTSVKLTGVLLKLKMKATEMAAAAASSRALALRQSPCPVLNQGILTANSEGQRSRVLTGLSGRGPGCCPPDGNEHIPACFK